MLTRSIFFLLLVYLFSSLLAYILLLFALVLDPISLFMYVNFSIWILFFLKIYVFLFVWFYREGEGTREVCQALLHCPTGHHGWSWPNLKAGTRSFFWASHEVAGIQGFEPSFTVFPGHKQETGWEVEQLGHELVPIGMLAPEVEDQSTMPLCWSLMFFLTIL